MTAKKFYDWQTVGGTDDVMLLVDCLERLDIAWCAIGGVAVNHWAAEPMVTRDPGVVFVDPAVALFPVEVLAAGRELTLHCASLLDISAPPRRREVQRPRKFVQIHPEKA